MAPTVDSAKSCVVTEYWHRCLTSRRGSAAITGKEILNQALDCSEPSSGEPLAASRADAELRWYLVYCKPHEDERALENLERQGFQCFRPIRKVERLRNGCKYTASEALFPRYLFIQLDRKNDNWYPIRSTRGISQIVRFDEHPLPVPDSIIEGIRRRLDEGSDAEPHLKPGERVRITDGAFSQLEAIFVANDGDERVVLLLNILQRDQRLSFPVESVRKIG